MRQRIDRTDIALRVVLADVFDAILAADGGEVPAGYSPAGRGREERSELVGGMRRCERDFRAESLLGVGIVLVDQARP